MHAVRNHAKLPSPGVVWASDWVSLPASVVSAEDEGVWPHSVGVLVQCETFLGTLHWPTNGADLGVGGFPMLRCFSCVSFGLVKGLSCGKRSSNQESKSEKIQRGEDGGRVLPVESNWTVFERRLM